MKKKKKVEDCYALLHYLNGIFCYSYEKWPIKKYFMLRIMIMLTLIEWEK